MATQKLRDMPFETTKVAVSAANSADLVEAVANQKIIVWELLLTNSDTTKTLKLQSGGSTDLSGALAGTPLYLQALQLRDGMLPVCETIAGEKLNVVASAATGIAGWIVYSTVRE